MIKQEATINGLTNGVSVVEKDNKTHDQREAVALTDIIYIEQTDENRFQDLYREEGFAVSEYDPELFNECIALSSVYEMTINDSTEVSVFDGF